MRPCVSVESDGLSASTLTAGSMGPILVHVRPSFMLRSIQIDQERQASKEVPLTMVPSPRINGLALIGPSTPAGRCSTGDQVTPSSSLYFRAATQTDGAGP